MFKKTREKSPYFLVAMDFGYTLLASVGLLGYAGYWLDSRYGTSPWFLLLGVGLGIATGFNSLFKRLNYLEAKRKKGGPEPEETKK